MSSTRQETNIHQMLQDLSFKLGRFSAQADMMIDDMHSCDQSHLKHPWPPQEGCKACDREIQRWVKRLHLQVPFRLFGPECVIQSADKALQRKINQAQARRNMGAGI